MLFFSSVRIPATNETEHLNPEDTLLGIFGLNPRTQQHSKKTDTFTVTTDAVNNSFWSIHFTFWTLFLHSSHFHQAL